MGSKVSVITVCRNAEEFIEQAINSVSEQTYKNIEYIVVDGNSTDNTVSIINRYINKIHYFVSEPDNGVYDAMNKGIKRASGDIIYFLNSDDKFYDKYVIENMVRFFQQNENVEFVYGPIIVFNPVTNESFIKTYENVKKSYFRFNVICQQAIFYKADSFKKVGLFDDALKIVGDYEWELRAISKFHINFAYYTQIVAVYRNSGISSPYGSVELNREEQKKVFRAYFSKIDTYSYFLINKPTYIFTYVFNIVKNFISKF
jgi:glycosyltransferase involved in cell wall biosynthesis